MHAPPNSDLNADTEEANADGQDNTSSDMNGRTQNQFVFQRDTAGFLSESGKFISMDDC